MIPPVVMRPISLPAYTANHTAPSGPAVIPQGSPPVGCTRKEVILVHVWAGALAARPSANVASNTMRTTLFIRACPELLPSIHRDRFVIETFSQSRLQTRCKHRHSHNLLFLRGEVKRG